MGPSTLSCLAEVPFSFTATLRCMFPICADLGFRGSCDLPADAFRQAQVTLLTLSFKHNDGCKLLLYLLSLAPQSCSSTQARLSIPFPGSAKRGFAWFYFLPSPSPLQEVAAGCGDLSACPRDTVSLRFQIHAFQISISTGFFPVLSTFPTATHDLLDH